MDRSPGRLLIKTFFSLHNSIPLAFYYIAAATTGTIPRTATTTKRLAPATQRAFDYEYGAAAMTIMASRTHNAAKSQE